MPCMPLVDESDGDADRVVAATLYLMSCHARNHCPRLAHMIGQHLRLLAHHDQAGVHVADTCSRLSAAWEAIRRHDEVTADTGPRHLRH